MHLWFRRSAPAKEAQPARGAASVEALLAEPVLLDLRHYNCPIPVLRANKVLSGMPEGAVVVVLATDPSSWRDIPAFASKKGHTLIVKESSPRGYRYEIRRGPGPLTNEEGDT